MSTTLSNEHKTVKDFGRRRLAESTFFFSFQSNNVSGEHKTEFFGDFFASKKVQNIRRNLSRRNLDKIKQNQTVFSMDLVI